MLDIIEREAAERNIPRDDFLRFAHVETGGAFDELASRGPGGAKGLFQFTPPTAQQYGIAGRELDAVVNTDAAARLYLDNRTSLVNRHERDGRPYLSGKPEPDGLDMYLAHQQGAGGYRSLQTAIATGSFGLESTRANILNNVGEKELKSLTGVDSATFRRMSDKDMAQTFVQYWDTKMDRIRIPEKGIEPISATQQAPSHAAPAHAAPAQPEKPAAHGIALHAAYDLTNKYDHVKYGLGAKDPDKGRVDCSGWVVEMQNATMDEINKGAGKAIFTKDEKFSPGFDSASELLRKAELRSGVLIQGKDVTAQNLKEGMIIGEDNGPQSWDKGRYKGIDHITMVVRDPKDGQLKISQSRGGEGVELSSLDSYLDRKHAKGVKLYASDPLSEARDLLQERNQNKQQSHPASEHKPSQAHAAADAPSVLRDNARGAEVRTLQQTLQQLGYKDAGGNELKADGAYGQRTSDAVKAFQRAHGLQDDGVVGRDTQAALKQAEKTPLLSEKTNPDHPLFNQAVNKLEQLGPNAFANRQQLVNAAGHMTFEAKVSGMQRIGMVAQSKDGNGLFAVQGQPTDPAHQRIYTEKATAAERPLEQSSNAVRQEAQTQTQVQDQHEQQRSQARSVG
ncbi:peptidoglycan-binding protein [Xanthomonas citri pv. fuscans]|uniref:Peptidoglycan-binding protein n=1 Tax=Xanthomonas citri pv. fuscans TaxID=366649 RepID=A0AB34QBQ0_XANCI|nr:MULTISPECIES: XVIPCD domain-containing protein [Xanthomonas]ATS62387.1 peptidoglycan-binding protein [Xanthomonas citri pv. phaseoli var. fuscans]ATS67846.1 peptidoglycan-binding protein [Xanthomonas citri pv. phaseoli var. fuscans]ATS72574.1 peptidoglycan-binding protein [Xanthomonas citri pv. phaseoli var. fuscans]ATS75348.1 peptidoglycan-binding protein [Xanthomonas citri pv. phaseoli var. fuscans]ATS81490.1 peptidoglycan-binding protein [Xanthomonas citri pv. phaseoli var. fuscans]